MNMKRILLVLAVSALGAFITTGLSAQCGQQSTASVFNSTAGYQTCTYTTPGTDIITKFWVYGHGATDNSGSQTTATMISGNGQASGNVYPFTSWSGGPVNTAGHPAPQGSSCDRTVFLYSVANGGAGQYLVMSVFGDGSNFDFDKVTNGPGNVCAPLAIPKPTVTLSSQDASYYYFTVTWPSISNLKGYYDTAPANNIITGLVLRTATSTSSYATSAWTVGTLSDGTSAVINFGASGTDTGAIPGGLTLRLAKPISTGTYLAISLLFDGASPGDAIRETSFVGAPLSVIGPTASPLFANVTADPTTVAWTSGDESRVASYQAYMSLTQNGTYRAIGQPVAALGSGHSYTVNYRVVAPTYYVKIKASKTDGTFVWSSAVKVTRLAPEPKPLPGKVGLRK
jgi:hypothetical protein